MITVFYFQDGTISQAYLGDTTCQPKAEELKATISYMYYLPVDILTNYLMTEGILTKRNEALTQDEWFDIVDSKTAVAKIRREIKTLLEEKNLLEYLGEDTSAITVQLAQKKGKLK